LTKILEKNYHVNWIIKVRSIYVSTYCTKQEIRVMDQLYLLGELKHHTAEKVKFKIIN